LADFLLGDFLLVGNIGRQKSYVCSAWDAVYLCPVVSVMLFLLARLPLSGKLPVLNLLTGRKSAFLPHVGDSLHRFTWNLARPSGTWLLNITRILLLL